MRTSVCSILTKIPAGQGWTRSPAPGTAMAEAAGRMESVMTRKLFSLLIALAVTAPVLAVGPSFVPDVTFQVSPHLT